MPDTEMMTPPAEAPPGMSGMTPPNAMTPPGPTGPATMAPNRQGQRMRGMVLANMAITILDKAIAELGSQSEEGQAVLAMLKAGKVFAAGKSPELSQAEMKLMGAQQRPMGGPPGMGGGPGGMGGPGAAVKSRLAALGMGGGPQGA